MAQAARGEQLLRQFGENEDWDAGKSWMQARVLFLFRNQKETLRPLCMYVPRKPSLTRLVSIEGQTLNLLHMYGVYLRE